jgi:glycosyltransferase involved in cell wall biosynthesis
MNIEHPIIIVDESKLAKKPVISVLMPTYLHGAFLAEAIEGVVMQQIDEPIELIIGEDCSPDNSRDVAISYQKKYPHIIKVVTGSRNIGGYENVNRMVYESRGDFLANCDGDDYWCDPSKLRRQLEVFRTRPNCSLVFHAAIATDINRNMRHSRMGHNFFSRLISADEIILGDGGLMPTASILVKREVMIDLPTWWKAAPIGDYPMALRAAAMGQVAYINRVMSIYRINVPHSWTSRYKPQLASRMEYARRIECMLLGFAAEHSHRFDKAVAIMISKYYSDPLVRLAGSRAEKQAFYIQVAKKLSPADRLLTWIAVKTGARLILIRDLLRKSGTFMRLFVAHLRSERISDDMPSRSKRAGD